MRIPYRVCGVVEFSRCGQSSGLADAFKVKGSLVMGHTGMEPRRHMRSFCSKITLGVTSERVRSHKNTASMAELNGLDPFSINYSKILSCSRVRMVEGSRQRADAAIQDEMVHFNIKVVLLPHRSVASINRLDIICFNKDF